MADDCESRLGEARRLLAEGKLAAAGELCKQILEHEPPQLPLLQLLVDIEVAAGRPWSAVQELRRRLAAGEAAAAGHRALADLLRRLNRPAEAVAHFEQALAGGFDDAATLVSFAAVLDAAGRTSEALRLLRRATTEHPQELLGWRRLAHFQYRHGDRAGAASAFERVVAAAPEDAESHTNLGFVHRSRGQHLAALASFRRALAVEPSNPRYVFETATALKRLAEDEAAFAHYDRIVDWIEADPRRHSLLLFNLLQSDRDREQVFRAHLRFGERMAATPQIATHRNPRQEDRRLKIGYVSGDFKTHVVAEFLAPLLAEHDRSAVEVHAYAEVQSPDAVTRSFESLVDRWRPIAGLGDRQAAELIVADQIDILVDLSGHTAGNRLGVFAHKPAPVQVSWLGYPGTTGLEQMDYRFADRHLAGPQTQAFMREALFRLPRASASYQPLPELPIAAPPALACGRVTFASTNSIPKITPTTVRLWARVLDAVPDSRLVLKTHGLGDRQMQALLRARFAAAGVAAERLAFEEASPRDEYLRSYGRFDILLDPVPYTGGSTTRGALWMGVPVITLEGLALHERMSAAMLRAVDLDDCVAASPDEYVAKAAALARAPARLAEIRAVLRDRLRKTTLYDPAAMARDLEAAYRQMWRAWLQAQGAA